MTKVDKSEERTVPKVNIKRGDDVVVIAGDDKGRRGEVLEVNPREGTVVVNGINMVKHHIAPQQIGEEGRIVDKELPIDISNVMVLCPVTDEPGKVYRKYVDGSWKRFHSESDELLDR